MYLKITSREQKYGGFLLNCTKLALIVLFWKSWQSTLWVDFKIESVLLNAIRKKVRFYTSLRNGSNYSWLSIFQNPKMDEVITWITQKLVWDNESPSFWMWFFIWVLLRRYQWDSLISVISLTRVCMDSKFFEYSGYWDSTEFMNFRFFLLKFK